MNMNDTEMKKLLASLERNAQPPKGLREQVLVRTLMQNASAQASLSVVERFLFTRPLGAAASIALAVTSALWVVFGGGFKVLLSQWIG
jgi:hypothetical protein